MKKMKKNLLLYIVAGTIVILLGYLAFTQSKPNDTVDIGGIKGELITNPFDSLTLPSDLDEATQSIFEQNKADVVSVYEEQPDFWMTWINIGNLYLMYDLPDYSIAAYRISLDKSNANILAYRNIAEVYVQKYQDYEQASIYYKLAIEANFSEPSQYVQLASILEKKLGRIDEAEEVYLDGLQKTNLHQNIMGNLITFYQRQGKDEEAKKYIRKIIELHPDEEKYQKAWGHLVQ